MQLQSAVEVLNLFFVKHGIKDFSSFSSNSPEAEEVTLVLVFEADPGGIIGKLLDE